MSNIAKLSTIEVHELEAKFFEENPGTEIIIAKWMEQVSNKITGPLIFENQE